MDAPPPLPRSFNTLWRDGSGNLDIIMQSTPTSMDPRLIDHAHITFQQHSKLILIGAPSDMDNFVDLTTPIHETWLEGLQGFASFEQTVAAQNISAHIRSTPHLPVSTQDYFINVIFVEAQDAARIAASREHRAVRIVFHLNITVTMIFDDDFVDDFDEADVVAGDHVEMDAAMGLGDASFDAVDVANVEVGTAFGMVEIEAMVGDDAVQPVDLEVVEIHEGGLSSEAIANHLTVDNFVDGYPVTCVICLENMEEGMPAGRLPCGHVFHPFCVTDWLKISGTCPICRQQFPDIGD